MLFNSYNFMLFFPIVLLVYFVIPQKLRYIWLLVVSYYFYMGWNAKYAILIAFSTIITWLSGLLQGKIQTSDADDDIMIKRKKLVVAFSFIINLGILIFFKYFDFIFNNIYYVLKLFGTVQLTNHFDIILPVGISFYTFQALGYTVDVYRGDIKPEKNILRYALFVSFFPQLVAGPIERSKNLLTQVKNVEHIKLWNYDRVTGGATLMLWGFFQKMVIADRAAILVDTVYNSYWSYGTIELIIATVLFAIQIYCDFGSYSMIAIGAAKVMGFELMENFNTPYFSRSIKEFWRRWHISLSTWFRDYLYIPLGGSRCSKVKKYRNLMITFLVSGLWHGANWGFIAWGGIHGLYQIIGDLTKNIRNKVNTKLNVQTSSFGYKFGQVVITFSLACFAWIFFRLEYISSSLSFIKRMFTHWNPWVLFDKSLYNLGLNVTEVHVLVLSLVALFIVDCIRYRQKMTIDAAIFKQVLWFRWLIIFAGFFAILIYGIYGPAFVVKQFIYFQF